MKTMGETYTLKAQYKIAIQMSLLYALLIENPMTLTYIYTTMTNVYKPIGAGKNDDRYVHTNTDGTCFAHCIAIATENDEFYDRVKHMIKPVYPH